MLFESEEYRTIRALGADIVSRQAREAVTITADDVHRFTHRYQQRRGDSLRTDDWSLWPPGFDPKALVRDLHRLFGDVAGLELFENLWLCCDDGAAADEDNAWFGAEADEDDAWCAARAAEWRANVSRERVESDQLLIDFFDDFDRAMLTDSVNANLDRLRDIAAKNTSAFFATTRAESSVGEFRTWVAGIDERAAERAKRHPNDRLMQLFYINEVAESFADDIRKRFEKHKAEFADAQPVDAAAGERRCAVFTELVNLRGIADDRAQKAEKQYCRECEIEDARLAAERAAKLAAEQEAETLLSLVVPAPAVDTKRPIGEGVTLDDLIAYLPGRVYCFIPNREFWPLASVNAALAPVFVEGRDKPIPANTWLDQNKPTHQMTWAPGEPLVIADRLLANGSWIEKAGCNTLNIYRPPMIVPKAGDVSPWLDHLRKLYPDEANHLIAWFAQRVQRPGEKINHCIVLGGKQGVGKDTILEPLKAAVGNWNFNEVNPAAFVGRFNSFVKSVILRVSETRDQGEIDRVGFYEHSKVFCAAPPDVHRCDEKHTREYDVMNVLGMIVTSNNADSLFLPPDDRRVFVAWNYDLDKEQFSEDYWRQHYGWLANGGNEAVAHFLASYDLSGFNVKAPPPKTRGWRHIVNSSRPSEDGEMADALDSIGRPQAITIELLRANSKDPHFSLWLADRNNRKKIGHRFEAAGYAQIENPDAQDGLWKINAKRQAVYALKELSLRDQLAAAAALIKATNPPVPPRPSQ